MGPVERQATRKVQTMQLPLQITFKNMDSSPAVEARIRQEAKRLERFSERISHCRVVVDTPHRRHRQGKIFRVSIDLTLPPRHEIAIGRERRQHHAHEEIGTTIRDAFEAAARRVEDHARRFRGDVKTREAPLTGKVVRVAPDHGFILTTDGRRSISTPTRWPMAASTSSRWAARCASSSRRAKARMGWQASTVQPLGKHHPA
jgi:ribosome-associated translation inhibitor RaiA